MKNIDYESLYEKYINQKLTMEEIAKDFQVNVRTIRSRLRKYSIPIRKKLWRNQFADFKNCRNENITYEQLYKMRFNQNKNDRQIARELGVKKHVIYSKMRILEVPKNVKHHDKILTKEFLEKEFIDNHKTAQQIAEENNIDIGKINYKIYGKTIFRKKSGTETYIGKKYYKLTVEEYSGNENGRRLWKCKCVCGRYILSDIYDLRNGLNRSCGCTQRKGKDGTILYDIGDMSCTLYRSYKRGADQRNLEFSITMEFCLELFNKQKALCALSNRKLILKKTKKIHRTASLDRIDSSEGYTEDNVQWIHKDINKMKWDFDNDYFIKMCQDIGKYTSKNNENCN